MKIKAPQIGQNVHLKTSPLDFRGRGGVGRLFQPCLLSKRTENVFDFHINGPIEPAQ